MSRQDWRPANLLNPVPAVLITSCDEQGRYNVMTAAWAGTVCSDPVMVSVSIRKNRYSHDIIAHSGEFVMNLTTEALAKVTDFAGVRSGKDIDKFALEGEMKLTPLKGKIVQAPIIAESPVALECRVREILELGSHDMFIADVVNVQADDSLIDPKTGHFDLEKAQLIAYSHGQYYELGRRIGKFGWSVERKKKRK